MNCDALAPTLFDDTERVARREHRCIDCGTTIKPGQRYHDIKGLWDGSWSAFAVCLPCTALRALAERLGDGCHCIGFGHLFDEDVIAAHITRRMAALRCATEDEARDLGAILGHLYGQLIAQEDALAMEYLEHYQQLEAQRSEPGLASKLARARWEQSVRRAA